MPRIRSVKPEFCTSLDMVKLSIPCRLHYVMLWTYADDEGRGVDDAMLLKSGCWPADRSVTDEDVEGFQAELERNGQIVRYVVNGRPYFEIVNFREHQRPNKPLPSKLPAPDEATPEPLPEDSRSTPEPLPPVEEGRGVVVGEETPTSRRNHETASPKGDIVTVFEAWKESTGRGDRTLLDGKRKRLIAEALKWYPVDDVVDAVRGWKHSPHHRGENDRHTVYNDLSVLLRDASRIEQFRDLERDHPATHAARKRPKSFTALELAARSEEVRAIESGEVA